MNNTVPTGCREIHYHMLHILSSMATLSSYLLRIDDVVSAHSDGNLLEEAHGFTSQWFQEVNHLSGIVLITKNVISNSDTRTGINNILVNDFIRITRHAEDYLNTEQFSVYTEISDPDRTQPSYNDGDCVKHHTIYSV